MAIATYDPRKVSVSFNGQIIDGFGPDSFIKVSRDEDGWSYQPSNSGGGARSRNPNKAGSIEVTLLNKSAANAILSAFAQADELTGEGVGEFLVKDRSTEGALCSARNAWIKKIPDWERAKEVGVTTWVIGTDEVNVLHDGLLDG